eukprot:TRINITY_DN31654_c0_g1_i2.p1 TRINITY_DN31654_c0_g1~~TRINITY_DN31654_c0_g1_i2.p1  ORF type:complete len:520 (+),score=80.23 TRINITY_DN31654_c0_g1_i2:85-1644(+)
MGAKTSSMALEPGEMGIVTPRTVLKADPQVSSRSATAFTGAPTRAPIRFFSTDAAETSRSAFESSATLHALLEDDNLPTFSMVLYLVLIPLVICCAHRYVVGPMLVLGSVMIVIDVNAMVTKDKHKEFMTPIHRLLHDIFQLMRSLGTTMLPMALAYFGGASFYLTTELAKTALDCSVAELPRLVDSGYTAFACRDGYVAADVQVGVPAWKSLHEISMLHPHKDAVQGIVAHSIEVNRFGGRRLEGFAEEGPVLLGHSPTNRYGYVAPIYTSHEAFIQNQSPVAWAVKAGSPVRWSECSDRKGLMKTCGMFAAKLWKDWRDASIIPGFGSAWGYNITHFHPTNMLHARNQARKHFASIDLGHEVNDTFVVAEAVDEYFGPAYPYFWITVTLLGLGLVDRCSKSMYSALEECKPPELTPRAFKEERPAELDFDDADVISQALCIPTSPRLADTPSQPGTPRLAGTPRQADTKPLDSGKFESKFNTSPMNTWQSWMNTFSTKPPNDLYRTELPSPRTKAQL